jgi:hypothetical protein
MSCCFAAPMQSSTSCRMHKTMPLSLPPSRTILAIIAFTNVTCQSTVGRSIDADSYINCPLHLLLERSSKPSSIPCRRTTPVPLHQEVKVPRMQAPLSSSTPRSFLLRHDNCLCSTISPAVSPTTALSDHYRTVVSHHSRNALVISCIRSPPSSQRVLHVH